MKSASALLLMLLIVSATPARSEELSEEMLPVPDEILMTGEAGFLDQGEYFIPIPLLVFTENGWIAMSMFLRAEHERLAEEAVKLAVAPLLAENEVLKRRTSISPLWKPVAIGATVAAALLTAVVVLK